MFVCTLKMLDAVAKRENYFSCQLSVVRCMSSSGWWLFFLLLFIWFRFVLIFEWVPAAMVIKLKQMITATAVLCGHSKLRFQQFTFVRYFVRVNLPRCPLWCGFFSVPFKAIVYITTTFRISEHYSVQTFNPIHWWCCVFCFCLFWIPSSGERDIFARQPNSINLS